MPKPTKEEFRELVDLYKRTIFGREGLAGEHAEMFAAFDPEAGRLFREMTASINRFGDYLKARLEG